MDPAKGNNQQQSSSGSQEAGGQQTTPSQTRTPLVNLLETKDLRLTLPLILPEDMRRNLRPQRETSYRVHSAHGYYVFLTDADPGTPRRRYNGQIHRIDQLLAMKEDPLLQAGEAVFSFEGTSWLEDKQKWNYPAVLDTKEQAAKLASLLRRIRPEDRAELFARVNNLVRRYFTEMPTGGKDAKARLPEEKAKELADDYIGLLAIRLADQFRSDFPEVKGPSSEVLSKVLGKGFEQVKEKGPDDILTGIHLGEQTRIPDELKIQDIGIINANVKSWSIRKRSFGRISISTEYPSSIYDNRWDKQIPLGVFSTESYSAIVLARGSVGGEVITELHLLPGRINEGPFTTGAQWRPQPLMIRRGQTAQPISPVEAMLHFSPQAQWQTLFAEAQAHTGRAHLVPYDAIGDVRGLRAYALQQLMREPNGENSLLYTSLLYFLPQESKDVRLNFDIRSQRFQLDDIRRDQALSPFTGRRLNGLSSEDRRLIGIFGQPQKRQDFLGTRLDPFRLRSDPFDLDLRFPDERQRLFDLRSNFQLRTEQPSPDRLPLRFELDDKKKPLRLEPLNTRNLHTLLRGLHGRSRPEAAPSELQLENFGSRPAEKAELLWQPTIPEQPLRWKDAVENGEALRLRIPPNNRSKPAQELVLPELKQDASREPQAPPRMKWLLDGLKAGKLRLTVDGVQFLDPEAPQIRSAMARFSSRELAGKTSQEDLQRVLRTRDPLRLMSPTDMLDPIAVFEARQQTKRSELQEHYHQLREQIEWSPELVDAVQLGTHLRAQADAVELHAWTVLHDTKLTMEERGNRYNLMRSWAQRMRRVAAEQVSSAAAYQLTDEKWVRPRSSTVDLERRREELDRTINVLKSSFSFKVNFRYEDRGPRDGRAITEEEKKNNNFVSFLKKHYPEIQSFEDFERLLLQDHHTRYVEGKSPTGSMRGIQTRIPNTKFWISFGSPGMEQTVPPESFLKVRRTVTALEQQQAVLSEQIKAAAEQEDRTRREQPASASFTEEQKKQRAALAETLAGDQKLQTVLGYHILRDVELAIHSGKENELTRQLRFAGWQDGLYSFAELKGSDIATLAQSLFQSLDGPASRMERTNRNQALAAELGIAQPQNDIIGRRGKALRYVLSSIQTTAVALKERGEVQRSVELPNSRPEPDYYNIIRKNRIPGAELGMPLEQAEALSSGYFDLLTCKFLDECREKARSAGRERLGGEALEQLWNDFFNYETLETPPSEGLLLNPYRRNYTPTGYPMTLGGKEQFGKHRYYSWEQESEALQRIRSFSSFAQGQVLQRLKTMDPIAAAAIQAHRHKAD